MFKQVLSGGCTDEGEGAGDCDHSSIAMINTDRHAMWPHLRGIIASGLWRVPPEWVIERQVMPSSRVIEKIRISDRTITVDTAAILARGYRGAVQQGGFVVYRRPVLEVTEIPYGRFDGYYERGDPFPTNLEIIYAWKPDGTVYLGTDGPDEHLVRFPMFRKAQLTAFLT